MLLPRLLRLVAAFLVVVLLAEAGFRLVEPGLPEPVTWYHEIAQAKAEQMDEHDERLDFVFAGTSQSYHAIDPELIDERLGSRSYNAGIPAGIPDVQGRWLFDAVIPEIEVDTVVWALSSVDLNGARPQSVTALYDSATSTRGGLLARADRWLSERSALFRNRRTLADPRSWVDQDDPVDQARQVLLPTGKRLPGSPDLTERERRRIERDVIGEFEVGGPMSQAIGETVEELRARDIDVVFVWLPEASRFVELLPDPSLQEQAKQEVTRLSHELDVPMIDVSDGFVDDDFVDFTHLGAEAATRLSSRLAAMLGSHHA